MAARQPQALIKYERLKRELIDIVKNQNRKIEKFSAWKDEFARRVSELHAAIARKDNSDWIIALQKRIAELHARMQNVHNRQQQALAKFNELKKQRVMMRNTKVKPTDAGKIDLPKFDAAACEFDF
jgi:predicted RNase H-like nuclease (RuvC/YqgF family)